MYHALNVDDDKRNSGPGLARLSFYEKNINTLIQQYPGHNKTKTCKTHHIIISSYHYIMHPLSFCLFDRFTTNTGVVVRIRSTSTGIVRV